MKSIRLVRFLAMGALAYSSLHASSFIGSPQAPTKTGEEREVQYKAFFAGQPWDFTYSFPGPDRVPPFKGSFRFVLTDHKIEGYEENVRGPRLILRGTIEQDSGNIIWTINFGALDSYGHPSVGMWDCAKYTRFGQWIPTSLSVSPDGQTISFPYPIVETGSEGNKSVQCREVQVIYHITRKHASV